MSVLHARADPRPDPSGRERAVATYVLQRRRCETIDNGHVQIGSVGVCAPACLDPRAYGDKRFGIERALHVIASWAARRDVGAGVPAIIVHAIQAQRAVGLGGPPAIDTRGPRGERVEPRSVDGKAQTKPTRPMPVFGVARSASRVIVVECGLARRTGVVGLGSRDAGARHDEIARRCRALHAIAVPAAGDHIGATVPDVIVYAIQAAGARRGFAPTIHARAIHERQRVGGVESHVNASTCGLAHRQSPSVLGPGMVAPLGLDHARRTR